MSPETGTRHADGRPASDPRIDRPIFIIGTGRSGTTLLHRLMSLHPDLAWFSNYTHRFPGIPQLAAVSRLLDIEPLHRRMNRKWKITPKAAESYPILNHLTDGAFTQPRELTADDITPEMRDRFRDCLYQHLRWQSKPRFCHKHTGFPRTDFIREIFPDALFVHVLRDGRAVANSLLNVAFFADTVQKWSWGNTSPDFEEEYRKSGEASEVLAGIFWKTLVERLDQAMQQLPEGVGLTVRYGDLVADPKKVLSEICEFASIPVPDRFLERLHRIKIYNADDKWKSSLSRDQITVLEDCLEEPLRRLRFI